MRHKAVLLVTLLFSVILFSGLIGGCGKSNKKPSLETQMRVVKDSIEFVAKNNNNRINMLAPEVSILRINEPVDFKLHPKTKRIIDNAERVAWPIKVNCSVLVENRNSLSRFRQRGFMEASFIVYYFINDAGQDSFDLSDVEVSYKRA
jgi:hypothetical protein